MQIPLDLGAAPQTSEATRAAMALHGAELRRAWKPLFEQALGDAAEDFDLVVYAFSTLRGYLQGNLIARRIGRRRPARGERDLVVRGVASAIRQARRENAN